MGQCQAWIAIDLGPELQCTLKEGHAGDHVVDWAGEAWTNGHSAVTEYGPEEPKNLRLEL